MRRAVAIALWMTCAGACAGPRVVTDITSRADTVYVAWGERDGGQGIIACSVASKVAEGASAADSDSSLAGPLSACRHVRVVFDEGDTNP